jgi:hypothetical protein
VAQTAITSSSTSTTEQFVTTRKILRAWRAHEFYGLIVYGPQGIGKSSYMLQVMYQVYRDWDKVFENLIFSLDDLVDLIKRTREADERLKLVGWDDAGVHGHKYVYFRRRDAAALISAWLDVARTKVAGLIITTVDPRNLLKPVRENLGMRYGKVFKADAYRRRVVRVYDQHLLPTGACFLRKSHVDYFNVYLPDGVYKRYLELRKEFYQEAEERLLEFAEESMRRDEEREALEPPHPMGTVDRHI